MLLGSLSRRALTSYMLEPQLSWKPGILSSIVRNRFRQLDLTLTGCANDRGFGHGRLTTSPSRPRRAIVTRPVGAHRASGQALHGPEAEQEYGDCGIGRGSSAEFVGRTRRRKASQAAFLTGFRRFWRFATGSRFGNQFAANAPRARIPPAMTFRSGFPGSYVRFPIGHGSHASEDPPTDSAEEPETMADSRETIQTFTTKVVKGPLKLLPPHELEDLLKKVPDVFRRLLQERLRPLTREPRIPFSVRSIPLPAASARDGAHLADEEIPECISAFTRSTACMNATAAGPEQKVAQCRRPSCADGGDMATDVCM